MTKCFNLGKVPSVWLKAAIILVLKDIIKDIGVSLNYYGIMLWYCIYKCYSSILNTRIENDVDNVNHSKMAT